MNKKLGIFLSILILGFIFTILTNAQKYINVTLEAIMLWARVILPSLLPFFFLTRLLAETNSVEYLTKIFTKPMKKLYNCPSISSYIFFMGIITGYPMGAKLCADCYEKQLLTKEEIVRINSFTSTSGPMFIIGSVGIGLFVNPTAGLIIFVSHLLGTFLNGFIYRNYKKNKMIDKRVKIATGKSKDVLNDSMLSSITAVLTICGFIVMAFILIEIFNSYNLFYPINWVLQNIFHIDKNICTALTSGLLEITRGCVELSSFPIKATFLVPIATFIISFGGVSIHLQSLIFLNKCDMKYSMFLLQKITQACMSLLISIPLVYIFL